MITYLQGRQYYEDLYDQGTVEQCRSGEKIVNDTFRKMEETVPVSEFKERPIAWYMEYSNTYAYFVEFTAGSRYHKREKTITEWMERDQQKDQRLAEAHLPSMPFCRTCGRTLEVTDKYYLSRNKTDSREEDVIFMLNCGTCNKRRSYWQDGTEWEGVKTYCEKCQAEMTADHKEENDILTSTYTCTNCKHSYTETMDFSDRQTEEEPADPFNELDRKRFCLDEAAMRKLEDRIVHLGRVHKLYADATERTEHADVYDAVNDIKQLKIVQLIETLKPVLEKAQYVEFKFGEPQLGQYVVIEFSCLDAKADRKEYDSKSMLRKRINGALEETNWRLMSDSIHHRMGYLSGRLRAYEGEEELKKLVEQRIKKGTLKPKAQEPKSSPAPDIDKLDKVEAIKLYAEGEKLIMDSTPIDNGTKRPDKRLTLRGALHPNLRLVIPLRDNDESVPKFMSNFDYEISSSMEFRKEPKKKRSSA